jgi:hypothetical protein
MLLKRWNHNIAKKKIYLLSSFWWPFWLIILFTVVVCIHLGPYIFKNERFMMFDQLLPHHHARNTSPTLQILVLNALTR